MSQRLAGRVAVVTGGAGGIGQVIAKYLAAEGAAVAVADVKDLEETRAFVEATRSRFLGVACDISKEAEVNAFADEVGKSLGNVDILVNNAALGRMVPFDETTFEFWSQLFSVNVNGCFLMSKAFLPHLKQTRNGRVINITTTAYWQAPAGFTAYVSTKGAINGFTHTLASELGRYGTTVNAIAPHVLRTPMTTWQMSDELFALQAAHQNIAREQTADDVAKLAVFLASDEADFITGQIHVSDGGLMRR